MNEMVECPSCGWEGKEMVKCPWCGWEGKEIEAPFFCPECKKRGEEITLDATSSEDEDSGE